VPERTPLTRRKLLKRFLGGAAALTVADLAVDSRWLEVVRQPIRLPNWHGGKVRVGFLTDPHINSDSALDLAIEAVELLRNEKPDVVLLGGDYLNYQHPQQQARLSKFAERVRSLGVPAATVLGNHDFSCRQTPAIIRAFERHDLRVLQNETLDLNGFQVHGYGDGFFGDFRPESLTQDRHPHSSIVLLHEPDFVSRVPRHASLQLSGHSHGGQMCLPFGISVHTPPGARKYSAGLYDQAPVPLYVSRGVGTTGPPFRLFCRPEVTILDISG
jgi:predicted MPP superfamily phosphohydrolase